MSLKAKIDDENKRLASRKEKQKVINAWLEEQQATINQQVKKGGGLLTGGGSGVKKRKAIK